MHPIFRRVGSFAAKAGLFASPPTGSLTTQDQELAVAVILLQIAFSDLELADVEYRAVVHVLQQRAGISNEAARMLAEVAEVARIEGVKLAGFFQVLRAEATLEERKAVYAACWEVIVADGRTTQVELRMVTKLGAELNLSVDDEIEARSALYAPSTQA